MNQLRLDAPQFCQDQSGQNILDKDLSSLKVKPMLQENLNVFEGRHLVSPVACI